MRKRASNMAHWLPEIPRLASSQSMHEGKLLATETEGTELCLTGRSSGGNLGQDNGSPASHFHFENTMDVLQKDIARLRLQKEKAVVNGDLKEVAHLSNCIGELLRKDGSFMESIQEYESEKQMCEMLQDTIGAAVACRMIGECYCSLERYGEAVNYQYHHLALAQECDDQVEIQRALATIGRTYLCQADAQSQSLKSRIVSLEKAEKIFLKALEVCLSLTDAAKLTQAERMAMKGRLLLNLGLVWDARGVEKETGDYLKRALTISEKYSLEEEQYLCHYNLACMYLRSNKPGQALRSLQSALKVASNLQDTSKEKEVYIQMATTNIQAGNFAAAKVCLKKAYKISSGADESSKIIKLFKAAAIIEEMTKICGKCDDAQFQVHEKMGDAFSHLGLYRTAITHYQKMLACGKQQNLPAEQLIPAYVSLAQTYADDNQPDLAIENYYLELELLHEEDYMQKCKSLLNIAEQEELKGVEYRHLSKSYMSAFSNARKANSLKLQFRVLKSLSAVQMAFHEEKHLAQTQAKLKALEAKRGQEDGDSSDEDITSADDFLNDSSGAEMELKNITSSDEDIEDSDVSTAASASSRRKRIFKINEKGESPLHVACIKGNLKKVRGLLSEGHSVKVRDHCGWTPLHEAANHGHAAIVELLLDADADINDRGGELCNGVTPLIDASSCGNMNIVQLLIQQGANVFAKDNNGANALRTLQDWYNRTAETLDEDCIQQYFVTIQMLEEYMNDPKVAVLEEKNSSAGKCTSSTTQRNIHGNSQTPSDALVAEQTSLCRYPGQFHHGELQRVRKERVHSDFKGSFPSHFLQFSSEDTDVTEVYRKTMLSLGSTTHQAQAWKAQASHFAVSGSVENKPSLVSSDEFVDDWLLNDTQSRQRGKMGKQRRSSRKANDSEISQEDARDTVTSDVCPEKETDFASSGTSGSYTSWEYAVSPDKGKCFASEDTHTLTSPDAESETTGTEGEPQHLPLTRNDSARVRVKIEDTLLLIPLPKSEKKTVGWLSEEASKRFSNQHGRRPVLNFSSSDGAVLCPDDIITDVLSHDEQLTGVVQSWEQPSLTQRYSQVCTSFDTVRYTNIGLMLKDAESSHIVGLGGLALYPAVILPAMRTLQGQASMRELHLAGNHIGDSGLELLANVLTHFSNLQVLNLACNDITASGLERLASLLKALSPELPLQALSSLDISNNPFGSSIADSLCKILTTLPSLIFLSISACQLTSRLFQSNRLALTSTLQGSSLQELDVSYNDLKVLGVELLLRCLKSSQITRLNIGHTMALSSHFCPILQPFFSMHGAALQSLSLEGCLQNCQKDDMDFICRLPSICPGLKTLAVSFSRSVTLSTLRALLSASASCLQSLLQDLDAVGCSIILSSSFCDDLSKKMFCGRPLRRMTFSHQGRNKEVIDIVTHLWGTFWAENALIDLKGQLVSLGTKKLSL